MDSCCAKMKAKVHPVQVSKDFSQGDHGFWGMKIKVNPKKRAFSTQLWRNLGSEKRPRKVKPVVTFLVLTEDISKKLLTFEAPVYDQPKADPKTVASIILGGGAGTCLFPLTRKRSKPVVPVGGCYRLIDALMSNCSNGIKKVFILTQLSSFSFNHHLAHTYHFGNGVSFGDAFVEIRPLQMMKI